MGQQGLKLVGDEAPCEIVEGTVKWFDAARGFGFVDSESSNGDVLLHVNVLRNFGQSSVAEGTRIRIEVQKTMRGMQATEVLALYPPFEVEQAGDVPEYLQEIDPNAPYLPARVKWFNKSKGFGFANAYGSNDDIFVHVEVLRKFGMADLQPGEAISLRTIVGERGTLAVEVQRWEHRVTVEE